MMTMTNRVGRNGTVFLFGRLAGHATVSMNPVPKMSDLARGEVAHARVIGVAYEVADS